MSKDTNITPQIEGFESISRIISPFRLLPNEVDGDIDTLRTALRNELKPSAPYEELLANELLVRVVEVKRERNRRDTIYAMELRHAISAALGLASGSDEMAGPSPETEQFAEDILDSRRTREDLAEFDKKLTEFGTSLDELHLLTHRAVMSEVDPIDKRIDFLEKRIRSLYDDFRKLSDARARRERQRDAEGVLE